MRYGIATIAACVFIGAVFAIEAALTAYLRSEFHKLGLVYPPVGFDVEVSSSVMTAIEILDMLRTLRLFIVVAGVVVCFAVAAFLSKGKTHSTTSTQATQRLDGE